MIRIINMFFVFVLLCLLPLLVTLPINTNAQKLQKIPITCDAGSFTDGQYGSVTCNFHKVMEIDKRGINVVLYPLNAPENELGTDVLACQWKETLLKYHCIVGEGYTFDGVISDRLTVGISAVGKEFEGLYMCFIVPSEETKKHGCELKLKDSKTQTIPGKNHTDPPDYKAEDHDQWIVPVVIVVVLAALSVLFVLLWKCWFKNKRPTDTIQADPDATDPLLPPKNHTTPHVPTILQDKPSNNIILEGFQLSMPDLERICKHLTRELEASSTTHCKPRIKRSTRVHHLPKGNEKGDFLSLSIGSDGVDIRRVILSGSKTECQSAMYDLPKVTATGEENTEEPDLISFFFGVAGCAKTFLKSQNLTTQALPVEYVSRSQFGPDDDVTMERVKECTEGMVSDDDMDKDATELQQHTLRKMNATHRLRIKPTVKDPVGTLLSGIYHDQACTVAFLPDVQLTACYVPKHITDQKAATITTIEWGEVADTGCLDIFRADIDRELNEGSENHDQQFLEKMVSCKHIGEILRLALLKLHKDRAVFMSVPSLSALQRHGSITFKHVSVIESDLDGKNGLTRVVLDELKMEKYTLEDCNIVRNVCKTIIERAAHLTAAALVALITHVKQNEVIIAVDGFMYRDHAQFYKIMEDKTKELLNGNHKFKLLPQYNGRRVGAAVASVLASKEDYHVKEA